MSRALLALSLLALLGCENQPVVDTEASVDEFNPAGHWLITGTGRCVIPVELIVPETLGEPAVIMFRDDPAAYEARWALIGGELVLLVVDLRFGGHDDVATYRVLSGLSFAPSADENMTSPYVAEVVYADEQRPPAFCASALTAVRSAAE